MNLLNSSISEGYFLSVNAAKHLKMKELGIGFGDARVFKFVAYYPESAKGWCQKALILKEICVERKLGMTFD